MNKKFLTFVFLFSLVMFFGCREKLDLTNPGPGTNLLITSTDTPNVFYVTTPSGGEILQKGAQLRIRWFVSSAVKTVALTLFRKNEEVAGITGATDNDGQYTWKIPSTIPSSVQYRIKLSNALSPEEFIFSEYFTINAPAETTE